MHYQLLSIILLMSLAKWCCAFTIKPIEFELLENKFRLSLPSDPDIKWVSFHVNINKEFKAFETGQLTGTTSIPRDKKWSFEFDRPLKDSDIIYTWLSVQHNRLIFRDKQDPISVIAFKSGNPNYKISTTTSKTLTATRVDGETSKPIDVDKEDKICIRSISEVPSSFGGAYCRGDLIFSDNFDTLNTQYWTNEIRIPSTSPDAEFVFYNGTLGVDNGVLTIEASLNSQHLKQGSIHLGERCTSNNIEKECSMVPHGILNLPPIITGRLTTKDHFSFKYGRVDVRAKMPIGDWLFPVISLQPNTSFYGEHYKSGEIRIAFMRGNFHLLWQDKDIGGNRIYGGVIVKPAPDFRYKFMNDLVLPKVKHFGDDFHLYTLIWTPDEITTLVDNIPIGRIKMDLAATINEPLWKKGGPNAPFDQLFHINLGLAVGGNNDFPDTENKPWTNTNPRASLHFFIKRNSWFPTWAKPSLEVDYVRVYAV